MLEPATGAIAYIGMGSNLDNPAGQIRAARQALAAAPGLRELACSSLYRSAPMGPADQPDYCNAAMAVATTLAPRELLATLQAIERAHGRARSGARWGPRTLDLDILLYAEERIADADLTIPHPGIAEREFVLLPLAEIAPPDLNIPGAGLLATLARACPARGIEVVGDVG
jgi:2-amino-4-hydroxy-6-hydroxymethyldihydropteridine diphosphokinase